MGHYSSPLLGQAAYFLSHSSPQIHTHIHVRYTNSLKVPLGYVTELQGTKQWGLPLTEPTHPVCCLFDQASAVFSCSRAPWFKGSEQRCSGSSPPPAPTQLLSVPTSSAARTSWGCTWATANSSQLSSNLTGVCILTTMKRSKQEQPFWLTYCTGQTAFLLRNPWFWFSLFYGSNSHWH